MIQFHFLIPASSFIVLHLSICCIVKSDLCVSHASIIFLAIPHGMFHIVYSLIDFFPEFLHVNLMGKCLSFPYQLFYSILVLISILACSSHIYCPNIWNCLLPSGQYVQHFHLCLDFSMPVACYRVFNHVCIIRNCWVCALNYSSLLSNKRLPIVWAFFN